jgi:tRNA-Thr(GGU) m(6)t(6)A37 methyltransferase TsaA
MDKTKGKNDKLRCSKCQCTVEEQKIFLIDGRSVCSTCLYGDAGPFEIYPIGTVRNGLRRSKSGFGTEGEGDISAIELMPSQKRFIYGLENEKHITVVYYFHKSGSVKSVFKRGLDGKRTGVFATRTPDRLSKIGIQDVRLVKVEETNLYVKGLDAIDGTPVLDIKLYWSNLNR